MTNRYVVDRILNYIRSIGYTIIDINRGNGYFIVNMGEDSVCHFKLSQTKGWKYGIWVNLKATGSEPAVSVFAQYESCIDKFKPSRSHFLEEMTIGEVLCVAKSGKFYKLDDMLRTIKWHPFISYYVSDQCSLDCRGSFIWYKIVNELHNADRERRNFLKEIYAFLIGKTQEKILSAFSNVSSVSLFDGNDGRWTCYPRYTLHVKYKADSSSNREYRQWRWLHLRTRAKHLNVTLTKDGYDGTYGYK